MKKFFDKDNFILSGFDKKQRTQSLIVAVLLCVFFLFSALTFLNFLYCFADIVGSIVSGSPDVAIKDALRSLPIFLSFFMSLWTVLLLHGQFRNVDEQRRMKSLLKNSIAIICFAGVTIIYVVAMRVAGKYESFVEGSPSPIYPLDAVIYAVVYLVIGFVSLGYAKGGHEKLPYVVPSRGPIVTKVRPLYCIGMTLWMLISLFSLAAFLLGLFIVDFKHGYAFFSVSLLFVYLVAFVTMAVWELYYNELKPEKRKEFLFPLSIVGLCATGLAMVLYFVSLALNIDGPSNMGFGILPIAFTASVNMATLVVVITPFAACLTAFIKALIYRKEAKKAE